MLNIFNTTWQHYRDKDFKGSEVKRNCSLMETLSIAGIFWKSIMEITWTEAMIGFHKTSGESHTELRQGDIKQITPTQEHFGLRVACFVRQVRGLRWGCRSLRLFIIYTEIREISLRMKIEESFSSPPSRNYYQVELVLVSFDKLGFLSNW